MPLFQKLANSLARTVSDAVDALGDQCMSLILQKYPDIDEVLECLNEMKDVYRSEDQDVEEGEEGDGKWRPLLLTLGLLYKIQRMEDSDSESWYNEGKIFVHDDEEEEKLLHTLGYYWHYLMKVAGALRTINNDSSCPPTPFQNEDPSTGELLLNEETYIQVLNATDLAREDILFAHATDSLHVDEHCPDFALVLLHDLKQALLIICGTRMIPAPKMKDVFMDLCADSEPFLDGYAHKGMAIGAKNIVTRILDTLNQTLGPDGRAAGYGLVVIGYSLGAGICQLVGLELTEGESKEKIPHGTDIRCISYGAPPTFRSSTASTATSPHRNSALFGVVHNNDGLASASTATVCKIFMQAREVERLCLRRRDMARMLWEPVPLVDGGQLDEDDEHGGGDDFKAKRGPNSQVKKEVLLDPESDWGKVRAAMNKITDESVSDLLSLEHPCGQLFLFKRRDNDVITRKLDNTKPLSARLRLRGGMLNHHMPWGYNSLFQGYGENASQVTISVLDDNDDQEQESTASTSLYPDLSQL